MDSWSTEGGAGASVAWGSPTPAPGRSQEAPRKAGRGREGVMYIHPRVGVGPGWSGRGRGPGLSRLGIWPLGDTG